MKTGTKPIEAAFGASLGDSPEWLLALIGRGDGGFVELRKIRRDGTARTSMYPADQPAMIYDRAIRLTEEGDVFVGMTVRGTPKNGTAANAVRANVLWADLDDGRDRLDAYPYRPDLVVESGSPGRFHAYWSLPEPVDLTNERERVEFRAALTGLQRAVGSDKVDDLARVMRVPGTLNWKRGDGDLSMAVPIEFRPEGVVL